MASISLLVLGFGAAIGGLIYFWKKIKTISGSAIILVIGLVGLYVAVTGTDIVLDRVGSFETGFPYGSTDYYLYQAFIYIGLAVPILLVHHFMLKDKLSGEISYAFWWIGLVLGLSGGLDLLIETFRRVEAMELRLCVAIFLLIGLIGVAIVYKDKFFSKKEEGKVQPQGKKA